MSEAWHQHLSNLSIWEQIDRWWNPSKYSCTISAFPETVMQILTATLIGLFLATFILWLVIRRNAK